jgi:CheY-like chemotaxis protein
MSGNIVLVDDVPESQDSSTALLAAEGYEVSTASDGEEALQLLGKRRPNAILFQILQPPNGAIDFVRRLALTRQAFSVPVVLVTALNEFQLGSFLNGVPGVRKVLYSPCSPAVLKDAVAQAVRCSHR